MRLANLFVLSCVAFAAYFFGIVCGKDIQSQQDKMAIMQAQQNESQSQGLEDQCKTLLKQYEEQEEDQ